MLSERRAGLLRQARLAPRPPLRQRPAPPDPPRDEPQARRPRQGLPDRPRRPAGGAGARVRRPHALAGARSRARLLLRARHEGDRRRRSAATSAAVCPPSGRRRRGPGEPCPRRGGRRDPARAREPVPSALAAIAIKIEDGGPVLYRQRRVGRGGREFELLKLRTMVVGAETIGAGLRGRPGRPAHHANGTRSPPALDRRAAAALERAARRDGSGRAATDPRLPGRAVHAAAAPPPRREARDHRLGAGERPRRARLGRPDRARRLVRRAPVSLARPQILARTPFALFGGTYKGQTGGWKARGLMEGVSGRPPHLRRPAGRYRERLPRGRRPRRRRRPEPARAGALPRRRAGRPAAGRRSRLPALPRPHGRGARRVAWSSR